MIQITQIKLRLSNAYLVQGEKAILVDSGAPGEADKILQAVRAAGIAPEDLTLIVHTHVHGDHVGSTAVLQQKLGIPTAYHPADQPLMDQGHNGRLPGVGLRGQVMSRFLSGSSFPQFVPDVVLAEGFSLRPYGVNGVVWQSPGHTAGSVSLLFPDGQAIIGDLLMGGYVGGNLLPQKPNFHYFAESLPQVRRSLDRIMAAKPRTLYVGHGGPLPVLANQPLVTFSADGRSGI
jgi:glyoxylase-like metal-dependent hydrolase (beta-lactamase superfamily II)